MATLVPSTPLADTRRTTFTTHQSSSAAVGTSHYSTNRRHSLYGTEDRVVLDPGCRTWRVGFSGEGRPREVFPSHRPTPFAQFRPREEGRTSLWDLDMGGTQEEREESERALFERLKDRLRRTFVQHLMVDPKSRKVVIAENALMPVCIKDMLARILFKNLHVPSVSFAPSGLLALLSVGHTTGLVIDIGHLETTILPIYASRPLYPKLRSTPLGGARLSSHLRDLLLLFGGYHPPPTLAAPASQPLPGRGSVPEDVLTDALLEDVKVRCCYVEEPLPPRRRRGAHLPSEPDDGATLVADADDVAMLDAPPPDHGAASPEPQLPAAHPTALHSLRALYSAHTSATDLHYALPNRGVLVVPGWVRSRAAEVFFAPGDVDEESLPELVLRCLGSLSADLRKVFVGKILVVGGTAAMRGLIARLGKELENTVREPYRPPAQPQRHPERDTDPWVAVRHLSGKFAIVNHPRRGGGEGQREMLDGRAPAWAPGSMVWVGGSLAGALKLGGEEIVRERYEEAEKASRRARRGLGDEDDEDDELDDEEEEDDELMDVEEDEVDAWKRGYRLPDWSRTPLLPGAPHAARPVAAAA